MYFHRNIKNVHFLFLDWKNAAWRYALIPGHRGLQADFWTKNMLRLPAPPEPARLAFFSEDVYLLNEFSYEETTFLKISFARSVEDVLRIVVASLA